MSPELKGKVRVILDASVRFWWGRIIGWVALDVASWHSLLHMSGASHKPRRPKAQAALRSGQPSP